MFRMTAGQKLATTGTRAGCGEMSLKISTENATLAQQAIEYRQLVVRLCDFASELLVAAGKGLQREIPVFLRHHDFAAGSNAVRRAEFFGFCSQFLRRWIWNFPEC